MNRRDSLIAQLAEDMPGLMGIMHAAFADMIIKYAPALDVTRPPAAELNRIANVVRETSLGKDSFTMTEEVVMELSKGYHLVPKQPVDQRVLEIM